MLNHCPQRSAAKHQAKKGRRVDRGGHRQDLQRQGQGRKEDRQGHRLPDVHLAQPLRRTLLAAGAQPRLAAIGVDARTSPENASAARVLAESVGMRGQPGALERVVGRRCGGSGW